MNRPLWPLSVAVLCQTGFEWTVGFWGAEYLAETTSLADDSAASAMTLFFAGILAGRLVGRSIASRLAPMVGLLSSFAIPLVAIAILALAPSLGLQLLGLTLCGVGIGNAYPMIAAEAGRAACGSIDGVLGRLTAIASSSIAAAPFVIGALGDVIGVGRAFWILPAVLALGTAASVALMRPRGDDPKNVCIGTAKASFGATSSIESRRFSRRRRRGGRRRSVAGRGATMRRDDGGSWAMAARR